MDAEAGIIGIVRPAIEIWGSSVISSFIRSKTPNFFQRPADQAFFNTKCSSEVFV